MTSDSLSLFVVLTCMFKTTNALRKIYVKLVQGYKYKNGDYGRAVYTCRRQLPTLLVI